QVWHYERDLPLCTVGEAWSSALAVYRKSSGCSEVSRLDLATGRLQAQRNGDAELGTRLLSDGTHVLATGRKLLNVWSRDLIRTMEYGRVPAPVEPDRQHRPGCSATSSPRVMAPGGAAACPRSAGGTRAGTRRCALAACRGGIGVGDGASGAPGDAVPDRPRVSRGALSARFAVHALGVDEQGIQQSQHL